MKNIAIIGCSGALGGAFARHLATMHPEAAIHGFSRREPQYSLPNLAWQPIDTQDETSIAECASIAGQAQPLDMVIVATGILHDENIQPEKSLRDLSADRFQAVFQANTIVPALMAKHFLPRLNRSHRSVFAALSARVGSISDNQLGGWYAYRASKAALNMILKNAAIEIARRNTRAIVAGLHPGTVDSGLSKPFQKNVPGGKLFTPEFSAARLISVLDTLTPDQSGKCFAWDGEEIAP